MISSCKRWHIPWESSSNRFFFSMSGTQCRGTLHRAWWWLFLVWIIEISGRLQMKAYSSYSTQDKCHFYLVNNVTCLNIFQHSCTNNLGLVGKKTTHVLFLFFFQREEKIRNVISPLIHFQSLILLYSSRNSSKKLQDICCLFFTLGTS